jgi:hypothetical protein
VRFEIRCESEGGLTSTASAESLCQLQKEIEIFLSSLRHPVLVEDELEVLDLAACQWSVTLEPRGLLLEAWSPGRSISRRIEQLAYRGRGRMGVFVRKPGGRESATLELREFDAPSDHSPDRRVRRANFRRQSLALLQDQFAGWRFERVSNRSDREHSFSAWYTRGLMRQGRSGWAFLALHEAEAPVASDSALAYGLIWLDWLRGRSERDLVVGLKLFLPEQALAPTCHRAAYLNRRAAQIDVWRVNPASMTAVDLSDFGNVETRLARRSAVDEFARRFGERHEKWLRKLLGEAFNHVQLMPEPTGNAFSIRLHGLEVARVEGELAPRVYFGMQESDRRLEDSNQNEFRQLVNSVLTLRQARSSDSSHEFYRLQSERWLESVVVQDITRIDPSLLPNYIYPQVPAFAAADRGVIDILGVTRQGRLAVIELKVQEEINLLMQGLDYWLRVKWLNDHHQFREFGYFPGLEIANSPPLLYMVCPAFRFHSTFGRMVRYLDPCVEIIQVGLNDGWREGARALFRRRLNEGG